MGGEIRLDLLAQVARRVGDAGAQALAGAAALGSLKTLDLSANGIGDAGAKALASSEHLGSIRSLEMFGNDFGASGASALKKRFGAALKL